MYFKFKNKPLQILLSVEPGGIVRSYMAHPSANIEPGADIGDGTRVWANTHIMRGAKIGKGCNIGENVHIASGVVIGDFCKIQNGVNIYNGVTVEDYVFFGPASQTTNELHIGLLDSNGAPQKSWTIGYTVFKKGCAIGANATIVCGTKESPTVIGESSVVGSGSVVTKSVPKNTTVVGNPAKQISK